MQRDLVKINIGNLPPKSEAVLKLHYYQPLEVEDLSYSLRIPMSYVPKYMGDIS
jgi:DNA-directed RNA polymerase specialized sigma24 family protein